MTTGRTLHVRCETWEQVEQFQRRKLRRGKLLSMKVPFDPPVGSTMTLGLELPNGVTVALDGIVQKASPVEGDSKTWIELELVGYTEEAAARIKAMATAAPVPAASASRHAEIAKPRTRTRPPVDELPADERDLFHHLTAELRRMRQSAVHDVLGVPRDAGPDTVRAAWMDLVRRMHPDLVARRKAPAITHLAEELTILANRAYDRLRAALVVEGRATTVGAQVKPPPGWLVGFDDLGSVDQAPAATISKRPSTPARPRSHVASIPPPMGGVAPNAPAPHPGEAFETRAREMLGKGDADTAQEVLAAALVVYPRSRPLRSLYYVASALSALGKGEHILATSQLETALAHFAECSEAARLLEHLRKHGTVDGPALRTVFR